MYLLLTKLATFAVAINQAGCDEAKNSRTFFGLPTWYRYLDVKYVDGINGGEGVCSVLIKGSNGNTDYTNVLLIGMAVTEMLLRIVALVAIGYVVYGGVRYLLSQGEPDRAKQARQTIVNALIGLGVALVSASVVSLIAGRLS